MKFSKYSLIISIITFLISLVHYTNLVKTLLKLSNVILQYALLLIGILLSITAIKKEEKLGLTSFYLIFIVLILTALTTFDTYVLMKQTSLSLELFLPLSDLSTPLDLTYNTINELLL